MHFVVVKTSLMFLLLELFKRSVNKIRTPTMKKFAPVACEKKAKNITAHYLSGYSGETLSCLSCSGVLHPWLCTTVQQCHEFSNDACGVRRYTTINGEVLYDIGCSTSTLCTVSPSFFTTNSSHVDVDNYTCNECCRQNYCNSQGCGSEDYPVNRGPVCFKCSQLRDPSKCGQVEFCRIGQMCAVYEEHVFEEAFYSSKCGSGYECHPDITAFGKRQTSEQLCQTCCSEDFCNDQCKGAVVPDNHVGGTIRHEDIRKEFLIVYPFFEYSDSMYVIMSSEAPGWLQVDIPSIGRQENITLQAGRNNLTIPKTVMNENYGRLSDNGIYLNSSVPLSVYVVTDNLNRSTHIESTEGYMAMPIEKLGQNHMVVCGPRNSEISVAALHDNTTVSIQLDGSVERDSVSIIIDGSYYRKGDIAQLIMQKLETISVLSSYDLTGTFVNSDKNVLVTAGSYMGSAKEPMVENQPPVDMADTSFIIPGVPANSKYEIILILPEQDGNSSVTIRSPDSTTHHTLTNRSPLIVSKAAMPYHVQSAKPVLTYIRSYGSSNSLSPGMSVWIPSTSQYRSRYTVSSPNYLTPGFFIESLVVIIPTSEAYGILLDGQQARPLKVVSNLYVKSVQYSVLTVQLTGNFHVISHIDPYMKFGVFVFGREHFHYSNGYVQFGFPAGI